MNRLTPAMNLRKPSLFEDCEITQAVKALSVAGIEERGAIFTRREVVEFILDLTGYATNRPLTKMRLLEPAFGEGDFLCVAIERLLQSWTTAGKPDVQSVLAPCIRAVELHSVTYQKTRAKVLSQLLSAGIVRKDAEALANTWLIFGDFLLVDFDGHFDAVVGNPPYVRQEMISDALMAEYRSRYRTIYDRADIYVPFIERSLDCLSAKGQLGFICADRWMKNRYGGPLRRLVAEQFHLKIYVDMVDTQAFHSDVIAYPAITVIAREKTGATRIAHRPAIDAASLKHLADGLLATASNALGVKEFKGVAVGAEPWLLESPDQLALARRLEREFPTIEDAGCKVGIVAAARDRPLTPFPRFQGVSGRIILETVRRPLPALSARAALHECVHNCLAADGGHHR